GAQMALDARSYGFAFPGVVLCYLALIRLAADPEGRRPIEPARWWSLYVLAAAFTLWSHLLAGLLVGILALGWLGLELPERRSRSGLVGWVGSNLAVLLLFLPWLLRVHHQWQVLEAAAPTWMTPPSLANLVLSWVYWIPFGRLGMPTVPPFLYWLPVGAAAVALPVLGAALGRLVRRRGQPLRDPASAARSRALRAAAWLGLGASACFVLLLWSLDRFDLAHVFHAPRYPLLAGGLVGGGLASLGLLAAGIGAPVEGRRRARVAVASALLAPWLVAGLVGQLWAGALEPRRGLAGLLEDGGVRTVYLAPPELLPFFHAHLARLETRSLASLPCDALDGRLEEPALVLDVNPWSAIERPRERLLSRLTDGGLFASEVRRTVFDAARTRATLYELAGLEAEWCRSLCRYGFQTAPAPVPTGAAVSTLAELQRPSDGWGDLELGPDLVPWRWGLRERAAIRFQGRLPAGRYVLHIRGGRQPFPRNRVALRGEIPGAANGFVAEVGAGPFALAEPVTLTAPLSDPTVIVEHPLWSPGQVLGNGDPRRLSFQLHAAWFEPAGS
ncbi:MAG TPA: hypothetical protein VJG13_11630, partial [Thermoanaerobaculia bacterium]|nr:hypothetical protein [Thermoanaerobaculia bacterium]